MNNNEFPRQTAQVLDEYSFSDALLQLFRTETISVKGEVDES